MGALAPASAWLPEDDVLLKNSIEAGASLESLAKGAVQFSRKFTVRELQDRWYSLLYDPVVSAEASFHMVEFERSAPTLPSKFSRPGNSKENKSFSGKRKAESVRSCYYALRKRIRNEPFNPMDLSFLVAPSDENFFGNEDEPLSGNCMLGEPMSSHFGLQESHLDIMHHAFPEVPADGGITGRNGCMGHGFHGVLDHPVEEDFPIRQDNIHEDIPHIFEGNPAFTGNVCGVEELGQPKQVPSMFGVDHVEANPTYGQINSDPGNVCSEFEHNQGFHSPIPECDESFQNLEYSSPLPEMPIWRTVEDISTPAIPVDSSLQEKDLHAGGTFALLDDGDDKDPNASGCDFVHANSKLKIQMACDELKSPAASTENYLAELSNSLLDFTNDELLLMDADGKEMIDKSYYDGLSLLLSSPNEVNQDHMPSPEPETSVTLTKAETVEKVQMQHPASAADPQFPELVDGIICCSLNTEDPDIPCNDDVFLPINLQALSASIAGRQNFNKVGNTISSSFNDFPSNQKCNEGDPIRMQRDQENLGQSHASSHMMGSRVMPEKGQMHPVHACGVKFELPNCDFPHLASRTPAIASAGSIQINSVNNSTDTLQHTRLKEDSKEIAIVKELGHSLTDTFLDKSAVGSDGYRGHERNASCIKQELDALATIQDRLVSSAELGSMNIHDSEAVLNTPASEIELCVESDDDDVPYFSDIEAMILDMDLDPDDQDLYEQEVSKYQHEDSRKAIIRLEQSANSYMQRAIASHGAFAILYGRYSKHYIKKPEVLLGRGTEDVVVDIDLGREGRANKISRRQAIINMDKVGSFHLKNLGKCSISVNNKEVAPGQSLNLNSSCLIEVLGLSSEGGKKFNNRYYAEHARLVWYNPGLYGGRLLKEWTPLSAKCKTETLIRGMPFIFETNQTCVKRYLDSIFKEKPNS